MNPKQAKRLSKASNRVTYAYNAGLFPRAYVEGESVLVRIFMGEYEHALYTGSTEPVATEIAIQAVEHWVRKELP